MKIYKQTDVKDCGIAVIRSLIKHVHHKNISELDVKKNTDYGKSGISIKSLEQLAKKYSLKLSSFRADLETVKKNINKKWFITIIKNKNANHYIIAKINNEKVIILDPINGRRSISIYNFKNIFSNIVIIFEEKEWKNNNASSKYSFKFILNNITLINWTLITVFLSIVFTFTSSIFIKLFLDKVLPGSLTKLLTLLLIAFIWINILKFLNYFFKKYLIWKLKLTIETKFNKYFFNSIHNNNFIQMNKLTETDLIRRFSLIEPTTSMIAELLFLITNDILMFITSLTFLAFINIKLFSIAFGFIFLSLIISLVFDLYNSSRYKEVLDSKLSALSSSVDMIYTKNNLKIGGKFSHWNLKRFKSYVYSKKIENNRWIVVNSKIFLIGLIDSIMPLFILFIAYPMIQEHKISIGSILLFLTLITFFNSSANSITSIMANLPQLKKNYLLIIDIFKYKKDVQNKNGLVLNKFKTIQLSNFNFGYDKNLLSINNLIIDENVILKGANGSGKSTLLNIINSNIYTNNLTINGVNLKHLSLSKYRKSIFYGTPNPYIPDSTIIEFIASDIYDKHKLNELLLNKEFMKLLEFNEIPLDTYMFNNACNLSNGQKQLVYLLPIFIKNYKLIILDEATESIDNTNLQILQKLAKSLTTLFIEVSHSNKTLKNGKEIFIEQITKN